MGGFRAGDLHVGKTCGPVPQTIGIGISTQACCVETSGKALNLCAWLNNDIRFAVCTGCNTVVQAQISPLGGVDEAVDNLHLSPALIHQIDPVGLLGICRTVEESHIKRIQKIRIAHIFVQELVGEEETSRDISTCESLVLYFIDPIGLTIDLRGTTESNAV